MSSSIFTKLATKLGVERIDKHGHPRPFWAKMLDPAGVCIKGAALNTYAQDVPMAYTEQNETTDPDDTGEDALDSTPELDQKTAETTVDA